MHYANKYRLSDRKKSEPIAASIPGAIALACYCRAAFEHIPGHLGFGLALQLGHLLGHCRIIHFTQYYPENVLPGENAAQSQIRNKLAALRCIFNCRTFGLDRRNSESIYIFNGRTHGNFSFDTAIKTNFFYRRSNFIRACFHYISASTAPVVFRHSI